jgi:hypothetical protein
MADHSDTEAAYRAYIHEVRSAAGKLVRPENRAAAGKIGGKARKANLSKARRRSIARIAATRRWDRVRAERELNGV